MLKGLFLLAANEARNTVKRQTIAAAFFAGAGVIALFAVGFFLNALHTWLSLRLTSIEASLYIGLGLLVIAGVVGAIGATRRARPADAPSPLAAGAALAAPLAAQTVLKRASLSTSAVIAVVIGGALLGRKLARD